MYTCNKGSREAYSVQQLSVEQLRGGMVASVEF